MSVIKIATLLLALLPQALEFEVASVKPSRSDGVREFQIHPGGRLVISGMSVKDLVRRTYMASDAVQDENRVVGGPRWVSTELYDIVAQSDGDLGLDGQGRPMRLLAMLKNLLEERFQLRVRTEARETALYDLVLASRDGKLGSGLKPSRLNCPVYPQGVLRPAPDPVNWCGLQTQATGTAVRVTAQGLTMREFAIRLQGFRSVGRPVNDQTNLGGRFDFQFEFAATAVPSSGGTFGAPQAGPGASLFTMLQDHLGLKLQAIRGPADFYVIESVARPTAN